MKKRKLPTQVATSMNYKRIQSESFLSCWFLSYCLLVSSAERFIIRSAGDAMRDVDNAELKDNLKLCFFQEAQHARSHGAFSEGYFEQRPILRKFVKVNDFLNYGVIETLAPWKLKLSFAAAMEQLNAEIACFGLQRLSEISKEESFRQMLSWHFVEEIEHREHVYDLMQEKGVGQGARVLGMILVWWSFSFWITSGAALICGMQWRLLRQGGKDIRKQGVLLRLLRSAWRYCRKEYHPSVEKLPPEFFIYQKRVQVLE
ncbi:predicted metal-dependent hydrolase [Hahella chejuensis KCTC 2396]|uniref:Predicted metal-dependent hydrolase n=1 Tax=Hahella chejuensis (strain KCTC 2396) TaxID=349521 RepID=Q2SHH5_HAHCH|nr:metal-dependent hydrolase [Hahella chejuensis]ABC29899.1 predicted metal-dependent hydrolase [Hahella chejuensis KCTC 2396]